MGKMKRFLAFLLALIMVVELVPFNAVEVSATESQQQNVGTGPNIAALHTTAASAADIAWNYTTALTGTGTVSWMPGGTALRCLSAWSILMQPH